MLSRYAWKDIRPPAARGASGCVDGGESFDRFPVRKSSTGARTALQRGGEAESGDTEQACGLQRVREDLQATDLLIAAVAPDVHHRHARGAPALLQIGVPEHDHGVALLDELVG